jgi:hypothetical protein
MFTIATDAAPGRPNEDFAVATPTIAVVADGAGIPFGGCHHGVSWYAQQLGTQTLAALLAEPDRPLVEGLTAGISAVAALHADTCDLTDPGTPCAAVGILRMGAERVDTLALSDVSIVVDLPDGPAVTCDLSVEAFTGTETEAVAGMRFHAPDHAAALAQLIVRQTAIRKRADGWWVAAADPEAARHAQTASYPRREVRRAAVLTDGATRPVDQMRCATWPDLLDLLDTDGPAGLINYVRELERSDPDGVRYPRTKRHDDATVVMFRKPP